MLTQNRTRIREKAKSLAVRYLERGSFVVASGSEPGKVYRVEMGKPATRPENWTCSCYWQQMGNRYCSHVVAAQLEAERIYRKNRTVPAWQAVQEVAA